MVHIGLETACPNSSTLTPANGLLGLLRPDSSCSLQLSLRQSRLAGMIGSRMWDGCSAVVMDRVDGDLRVRVASQRLTGVRVDVETREIAAGDIQPDAMSGVEDVAGAIHRDLDAIDLARLP